MIFLLLLVSLAAYAQQPEKKFQGQAPVQPVDTSPRPVQLQYKTTYAFKDIGVYISNEFEGAHLNGILRKGDTLITWITPENTPINPSPWYAFKLWADQPQTVLIKMTYQDAKHRYYPKISLDGEHWSSLDSAQYTEINKGTDDFGAGSLPQYAVMKLEVSKDTLWVAGQELQTSRHVFAWIDSLAAQPFIRFQDIGQSRLGRPMRCLEINEAKKQDRMMLVIGRQHPPEVTGWLAMKSFVETLAADTRLARKFREKYAVYVVPLMNPDGADLGHWRHNAGGVDLNRDWDQFNHPETRAVRDFLVSKTSRSKLYFGIDFHSTWDDIFYTLVMPDRVMPDRDSTATTHTPGLTEKWLRKLEENIPDYEVNAKGYIAAGGVSKNFLYQEFGAESLVYEVGDNTPRPFVRLKGKVAAEQLMRLLLEDY